MDRREQVNFCEQKAPRKLPYTPFSDTSSQGSCNRLPQNYYSVKPMKIKFICNFGGRFLPRPSDGELRYVGGEKHLVKISRDISWQELICKTTKLIRRAHMIKYHLPGEQVNMLISITCDDDLCNMIDECIVLERNKARLTMYLFSDINDENYVHFALGNSSDTEKEAQFIALVNGLVRPGEELRKQTIRSTSAIDLELMFGINEEGLQAGKTDEASLGNKSKLPQSIITVPQKTPPSSQTEVTKQYYKAQINEGNPLSTARKMSNGYLDSSVSYESTHIAKEEAGGHAISRHQPGLQQIATNMIGQSQAKEKGSPRKQLLIPVDNSTAKIVSSKPNNNSPIPHISRLVYEMPAPLSRGSEKIMNQPTSFDDNKMKPGKYSTEEEAIFHLSLPNKIDMSECSQEPGTPTRCHDDMHNSPNLHALEKPVATKSLQKQQAPVNCTMKKDHPSNPTSGETVLSCSSIFSDRTTELQPNILARASSEIEQERPNSQRSHEKLSKMARSRSVGADSISPRIKTPPEEAKDNFSPLTTEFEVSETIVTGVGVEAAFHDPGSSILDHGSPPILAHSETKNSEQTLPVNAVMERDHLSNVQIIGNEDLEDLREMGSGAFGTVFHGRWKGTDVAIKRIKNSCFMYPSSQADKLIIEFWKEAAIISKLHHPNILAFYGVVNNGPGGTLATVTEFMVNGSLKKVLLHKNKYLDWRKRIMLAMDAAIGMEYLHSKEIVHFDLKCDNLLVNVKDPSRPICKVADFGLSKMKQASLVSGGMRGTLPWMAPELLTMSGTKVSEKVDVYSFGVVLWEILTGEDPYDGMHYGGVIGGILSNTLRPPVPTSCNPEWRKLMEQCWSTEPERRPSFTEVATCLRSMLEASQSGNLS